VVQQPQQPQQVVQQPQQQPVGIAQPQQQHQTSNRSFNPSSFLYFSRIEL
jgi:hypothetical protein